MPYIHANCVMAVSCCIVDVHINACTSCPAGDEYDLYSRFFGPWAGITEDPVTGSAHAVLAPYWSQVLGKKHLFGRQCSERGGNVWMDVGAQPGRVLVSGEATLVEQQTLDY